MDEVEREIGSHTRFGMLFSTSNCTNKLFVDQDSGTNVILSAPRAIMVPDSCHVSIHFVKGHSGNIQGSGKS